MAAYRAHDVCSNGCRWLLGSKNKPQTLFLHMIDCLEDAARLMSAFLTDNVPAGVTCLPRNDTCSCAALDEKNLPLCRQTKNR